MNHSAKFGNILKELREREKLSALQLAKKTGISVPTIHKVESGNTQIRMSNLHQVYRSLCKNQKEWLKLCVQWLASHPEVGDNSMAIMDELNTIISDRANYSQKIMEDMAYLCSGKTPADIKLIKRVATNLKNRPFSIMVKSYLDAVEQAPA